MPRGLAPGVIRPLGRETVRAGAGGTLAGTRGGPSATAGGRRMRIPPTAHAGRRKTAYSAPFFQGPRMAKVTPGDWTLANSQSL